MTIMGKDKPGLVESVAKVIADKQGNWLESRLCHLGGQFAGVLRVEIRAEAEADLLKSLLALQEKGLSVTIKTEAVTAVVDKRLLVSFELVGQDQPGIVSRITGILAGLNINLEELTSELETAPMSAELLFKSTMLLSFPEGLEPEVLRSELEDLASDMMVDFQLRKEI